MAFNLGFLDLAPRRLLDRLGGSCRSIRRSTAAGGAQEAHARDVSRRGGPSLDCEPSSAAGAELNLVGALGQAALVTELGPGDIASDVLEVFAVRVVG